MPSEFTLVIGGTVTPENKAGPRVGIMGKARARRDSDGAIGIQIRRGNGSGQFTYTVRTKLLGPFLAGEEALLEIGAVDLPTSLLDFTPRLYQLRIVADGGADLLVTPNSAFIATEPYAPAGTG